MGRELSERYEEELREISRDQLFAENLDFLHQEESGLSRSVLQENEDPNHPTPAGFYSFKRDGTEFFVRKSSLLWMMDNKQKFKVSTDRARRFITNKEQLEDDYLTCGGFVLMKVGRHDELCQVIGFKFLTGRETFTGSSCPLEVSEDKSRGVAVLCNIFNRSLHGRQEAVTSSGLPFKYIDIKAFKAHVKLRRDLNTNQLHTV